MRPAMTVLPVLLLTLVGCTEDSLDPETLPNMIGVVYLIDDTEPTATRPSTMWLDHLLFPQPRRHPTDSAGIIVGGTTPIVTRGPAATLEAVDFTDIAVADTVQVWHGDMELRSDPPQYFATRVEVLKGQPSRDRR